MNDYDYNDNDNNLEKGGAVGEPWVPDCGMQSQQCYEISGSYIRSI